MFLKKIATDITFFNNIDASKDDIIADSVILNMNYQNYNNPLKDTLLSKFYYKEKSTYIDNFIIFVEENLEKIKNIQDTGTDIIFYIDHY